MQNSSITSNPQPSTLVWIPIVAVAVLLTTIGTRTVKVMSDKEKQA